MPKFYEDVTFKRAVSALKNIKINGKEPKAIFIADDVIFFRDSNDEHITLQRIKDKNNKDVYKEIRSKPTEILSTYGYNIKSKSNRNRIDYAEMMKVEFSRLIKKDSIDMELIQKYTKDEFYQTYVACFASTSSQKNSSDLFKLGKLKEKYKQNAVDIIYDLKFKNDDDDSKKKQRRADINKNLKGIDRFMIFSNRLQKGVYQFISIPITYFVKIKNDDWIKVLLEVDPHTAHLSINDDDEDSNELLVEVEEEESNEVEDIAEEIDTDGE